MKDIFERIGKTEKNEHTALILMLGVLGEKLTDVAKLIEQSNKLSADMLSCLQNDKMKSKTEIVIIEPLTPEDYME